MGTNKLRYDHGIVKSLKSNLLKEKPNLILLFKKGS